MSGFAWDLTARFLFLVTSRQQENAHKMLALPNPFCLTVQLSTCPKYVLVMAFIHDTVASLAGGSRLRIQQHLSFPCINITFLALVTTPSQTVQPILIDVRFACSAWFDCFRNLPHRVLVQIVLEVVEETDDPFIFLKRIRPFLKTLHVHYDMILLPTFGKVRCTVR